MSRLIYWEMQDADMMCAVHALNSLIQYPKWDAISLGNIGRELDIEESELTNTEIKNLNVREDGFFSIQAISRALEKIGLKVEYFNISKDPCSEQGFICNLDLHWIALRKIDGTWFDLNSLADAPEIISEFRLSAWMSELSQKGFSIFAVIGDFPDYSIYPELSPIQMRLDLSYLRSLKKPKFSEEDEILKAIQLSQAESEGNFNEEIRRALEMSRAEKPMEEMTEEELLKLAIEMSNKENN